jgi:hypothetical protein
MKLDASPRSRMLHKKLLNNSSNEAWGQLHGHYLPILCSLHALFFLFEITYRKLNFISKIKQKEAAEPDYIKTYGDKWYRTKWHTYPIVYRCPCEFRWSVCWLVSGSMHEHCQQDHESWYAFLVAPSPLISPKCIHQATRCYAAVFMAVSSWRGICTVCPQSPLGVCT